MKKPVQALTVAVLVMAALLVALPASARVAPSSDLQLSADGHDGMAAPTIKCERSRDRCFPSNRAGCNKAC